MQREGLRRRSFVVRYLTLFGGEAGSKVCVILAFAYLARALGPRDFGAIELALSVTIFFVLAAETGLGSYGARIVETAPDRASQLIPQAGLLRAMLAVPAYAIIVAIAPTVVAAAMSVARFARRSARRMPTGQSSVRIVPSLRR